MASVFKAKGAEKCTILYTDEHGERRKKIGCVSKRESERLAMKLEERAAQIRDGQIDPAAEGYRDHEGRPLSDHLRWKGCHWPRATITGPRSWDSRTGVSTPIGIERITSAA
jgi:hypothetical protein